MNRASYITGLLVVLSATGCGKSESGRVSLAGRVTLQGETFERGAVVLRPIHGTSGPACGGPITNGSFQIPAESGPTKGHYLAKITVVMVDNGSPGSHRHVRSEQKLATFQQEIELADDANVVDWQF